MEATPLQDLHLHLHYLRAIKVLGHGAMGTVFLVHNLISDPSASSPFALKVVDKSCLHDSDRRARWEMSVLDSLNHKPHPFLPFLIGFFETQQFLAWAIPFCPGRDLNVLRHRQSDHVFSTSAIRFYLAEILCALEHLHTMGIVYRDLKPENILIQQSGHVTLTDFDLSRTLAPKSGHVTLTDLVLSPKKHNRNLRRLFSMVVSDNKRAVLTKTKSARVSPVTRGKTSFSIGERSSSFVGTEEYLSPEMVRGDGHEFAVDWWALGILAYEMLYGTTPFRGKNRMDTLGRILMMQPKFTGKPTPLTDLISKLLEKQPTRRLGYRSGACEIKEHLFFRGLQWKLLTQVVRTPFIPSKDNVDLTTKINIKEYLQKLREPPSPLDSPSCTLSSTEF